MQEEADLGFGEFPANQFGQKHKLVIVNPYLVLGVGDLNDRIAKRAVDLLVSLPELLLIDCVQGEIMEQWPNGLVGKALIVILDLLPGEMNGMAVFFGQPLSHLGFFVVGQFFTGNSGPANPQHLV